MKKFEPLVSIIIPTYNHGVFLDKALKSVLNQTYQNWEVIVVDNHSTDNTRLIVNKYQDFRIKYLTIQNKGVIAKSRNKGILAAKGDWIAFLDSDDWWTSEKLKTCMKNSNEVDLIYHNLEIVSKTQRIFCRKIVKSRKLKKPITIDLLVNGNAISNSSVIVRKKFLQNIGLISENHELVASEDYNTWLKISTLTENFFYIPKTLGYYFIHDQGVSQKNLSSSMQKATNEFLYLLDKNQKIKLLSNIRYLSGRFNYLKFNYFESKKDLFFVLRNGFIDLKIKSIFMLIIIFLKINC